MKKGKSNQKDVIEKSMFTVWSKKIIYSWPQSNFGKNQFWDNLILRKEKSNQKAVIEKSSQLDPKKSFTHSFNPILENQIWDNRILKKGKSNQQAAFLL